MDIQDLVGLFFGACRFSKGSYTFEFSGRINGKYKQYSVATDYYFSREFGMEDARENFSSEVWDCLEKDLKSVRIEGEEPSPRLVFIFEDDTQFVIWYDEPQEDNLLIVTDRNTGDWFPIL